MGSFVMEIFGAVQPHSIELQPLLAIRPVEFRDGYEAAARSKATAPARPSNTTAPRTYRRNAPALFSFGFLQRQLQTLLRLRFLSEHALPRGAVNHVLERVADE